MYGCESLFWKNPTVAPSAWDSVRTEVHVLELANSILKGETTTHCRQVKEPPAQSWGEPFGSDDPGLSQLPFAEFPFSRVLFSFRIGLRLAKRRRTLLESNSPRN